MSGWGYNWGYNWGGRNRGPAPRSSVPIIDGAGFGPSGPPPPPAKPARIGVGLCDRKGMPAATSGDPAWAGKSVRDYVKVMVQEIDWNVMQTAVGQSFPPSNPILSAMATSSSNDLQLVLRPYFGLTAAAAIKALHGGPMGLTDPIDLSTFTVGLWWLYIDDAVASYMAQLAAYLTPGSPLVEVCMAGASTKYAEQDLRQNSYVANRTVYADHGYTYDLDLASQRAVIAVHKILPIVSSRAHNPYQNGLSSANSASDSIALMDEVRSQLGFFGSLGNNSMRYPGPGPNSAYDPIYAAMQARQLGGPSYIQTAQPANVGSVYQTCLMACDLGVQRIELPGVAWSPGASAPNRGYTAVTTQPDQALSPGQMDDINGRLADNAGALGYDPDGFLIAA